MSCPTFLCLSLSLSHSHAAAGTVAITILLARWCLFSSLSRFFCVLFQGTDGKSLLSLTKDQIMDVIGFKIGPTLKIYHLIQQLKIKSQKANLKKSYLR